MTDKISVCRDPLKRIVDAISSAKTEIEALRYEIQSMRKSVQETRNTDSIIGNLNIELAHLRGRLDATEPILESLVEGSIAPMKMKHMKKNMDTTAPVRWR